MAPDPKKDKKAQQAKKPGAISFNVGNIKKWHIGVMMIFVGLGAVAGYFFMFHQAQTLEIEEIAQDVKEKEDKIRTISTIKTEMEKTLALIAEKEGGLAHLEQQLPEFAFIPEFMLQIEQLALGYNLKIVNFEPAAVAAAPPPPPAGAPPVPGAEGAPPADPAAPGATPGAAPAPAVAAFKQDDYFVPRQIGMRVEGRYNQLLLFMQELAVFPKVLLVDKVTIKTVLDDEKETNALNTAESDKFIEVELFFKFYSRKEGASGGGPAAAPGAAPAVAPGGAPAAPPAGGSPPPAEGAGHSQRGDLLSSRTPRGSNSEGGRL